MVALPWLGPPLSPSGALPTPPQGCRAPSASVSPALNLGGTPQPLPEQGDTGLSTNPPRARALLRHRAGGAAAPSPFPSEEFVGFASTANLSRGKAVPGALAGSGFLHCSAKKKICFCFPKPPLQIHSGLRRVANPAVANDGKSTGLQPQKPTLPGQNPPPAACHGGGVLLALPSAPLCSPLAAPSPVARSRAPPSSSGPAQPCCRFFWQPQLLGISGVPETIWGTGES